MFGQYLQGIVLEESWGMENACKHVHVCVCMCKKTGTGCYPVSGLSPRATLQAESCLCIEGKSSMVSPTAMGSGTLLSPL